MLTEVLRFSVSSSLLVSTNCWSAGGTGDKRLTKESLPLETTTPTTCLEGAFSPSLLTPFKDRRYSWSRDRWEGAAKADMYPSAGPLLVCTCVRQDALSNQQKGLNLHGADKLSVASNLTTQSSVGLGREGKSCRPSKHKDTEVRRTEYRSLCLASLPLYKLYSKVKEGTGINALKRLMCYYLYFTDGKTQAWG